MEQNSQTKYRIERSCCCGRAKAWERAVQNRARLYEGMIIEKDQIPDLVADLQKVADTKKNAGTVDGPNWKFSEQYGTGPSIHTDNCYTTLQKIAGPWKPLED